jgi:hypothetical protein
MSQYMPVTSEMVARFMLLRAVSNLSIFGMSMFIAFPRNRTIALWEAVESVTQNRVSLVFLEAVAKSLDLSIGQVLGEEDQGEQSSRECLEKTSDQSGQD